MRQTYYFLSFVLLLFVFISCSDDVVGKGTDTIGLKRYFLNPVKIL